MTRRNWRILMATVLGLGLAYEALEFFSRGTISTLGAIAAALVSIGFVGNLLALVKGW
jgi:hypothetical protein